MHVITVNTAETGEASFKVRHYHVWSTGSRQHIWNQFLPITEENKYHKNNHVMPFQYLYFEEYYFKHTHK